MSKTYNKLKIEIKDKITDIITAKQDDSNSRYLDVYLYDDGLPINLTGNTVRIYMRKPDGTEIFNNGQITSAAMGRCQFELTSQALGAVGVLFAEISIWKNNTEILTSQTFHIFVAETLRSTSSIESSNEYGALVVLFQNLYESLDMMQDIIQNFGQAGALAQKYGVDTFWEISEAILDALKTSSTAAIVSLIGQPTDIESNATLFGNLKALTNTTYGLNALKNLITNNKFYARTVSVGKAQVAVRPGQDVSEREVVNIQGGGMFTWQYSSSTYGTIVIQYQSAVYVIDGVSMSIANTWVPIFFNNSLVIKIVPKTDNNAPLYLTWFYTKIGR